MDVSERYRSVKRKSEKSDDIIKIQSREITRERKQMNFMWEGLIMKTAIIKRIVTGTLALVMAFAAIPAAETISGTNILSVTSYAASPDEFTQYDLDCCIDAWENFKANGRGYLLVNYWSNEIEKKAVYACQSMLNLVAEE